MGKKLLFVVMLVVMMIVVVSVPGIIGACNTVPAGAPC